jgi:hypothetical protein
MLHLEVTGYGLAKAMGIYLDSKRATSVAEETFGPEGNRTRVRTARRWLNKMGLVHDTIKKGVFVDGHEREDVVQYRKSTTVCDISRRWNSNVTGGRITISPCPS